MHLIFRIEELVKEGSISSVLLVPQKLHLHAQRQSEEPPALIEHLIHELLTYSVIDHVEESAIQARLNENHNQNPFSQHQKTPENHRIDELSLSIQNSTQKSGGWCGGGWRYARNRWDKSKNLFEQGDGLLNFRGEIDAVESRDFGDLESAIAAPVLHLPKITLSSSFLLLI